MYPVLMMEYQTMSSITRLSSTIKTWAERCETHPDHQMGMITHAMICLRMQEEIDELREALETLERANP